MCHLILMLPVFWLLPLTLAGPVYGAASAFAGVVYYYTWETGRRPVVIGRERLGGATGKVLETVGALRIRVDGEIWRARSTSELTVGDTVLVDELNNGLILGVSKAQDT